MAERPDPSGARNFGTLAKCLLVPPWDKGCVFLTFMEAPPGFEPGMEVLQTGPGRPSSWFVLLSGRPYSRVLPGVRARSFPSCSQVHIRMRDRTPSWRACHAIAYKLYSFRAPLHGLTYRTPGGNATVDEYMAELEGTAAAKAAALVRLLEAR